MTEFIFCGVITCLLFLNGSLVVSIAKPKWRVWPPPRRFSWQYWFTWGLFSFGVIGLVALGLLDWNSLHLRSWIRMVVGAPPLLLGAAFALWGVSALGVHASQGLGGALITAGPYRYSRNPQYVGNIAFVLGFGILCGSPLTVAAAISLAMWFVLAPFAEEPWLREELGASYERYSIAAPRFLSFPVGRGRSAA